MKYLLSICGRFICPVCTALLIIAGLCHSANAQDQELLHKTYAARVPLLVSFYVEDLVNEDSIALFTRINAIRKLALESNDEDLLAETSLMRAHYFYYRKFSKDLILPQLDSLRSQGKKQKRLWLEIMAENMTALYYFKKLQNYELAFEHHERVYNMLKDIPPSEFPYKQECLYQLADEYYYFNDFPKALFYNKEALKAHPPVQLFRFSELNIQNTIGLCYQKLGKLNLAAYYFKATIAQAQTEGATAWDGIASGNLGYNLFLEKKYDAAIPLLEKDVRLAVISSDWGLASGSQMILASISLIRSNRALAGEQIKLAREYVQKSGQYHRLQDLYPLMAKWYTASGQPGLSARYLDSAMIVKDSINRKVNALQLLRAMQKVDLERHNAEIGNIDAQKSLALLQRNVLLAAVMGLMLAAVFTYKEQQKRVKRQQEQASRANKELDDASKQLSDFARNISEKNALIDLLEQQNAGEDKEALWKIQQSTILTDADWAYFRGLFEKVHSGYLQRLKEKMPGLTPAETRLMALSKLGLSTREMAAMLGIGTDAVRQIRSRLRKKLDLSEEGNLEDLATRI